MPKRSNSGISNGGGGNENRELSDSEMQSALDKHFAEVNATLDKFMNSRAGTDLSDLDPEMPQIEKSTIKELKSNYIDPLNDDLKNYGDAFTFGADDDTVINILYKSGEELRVSPDSYDGTKRIPTSNIDSIIVEGGWGSAFAGKNVELYNMRETVGYGKYAYRNVKERYNDYDSIRLDFK